MVTYLPSSETDDGNLLTRWQGCGLNITHIEVYVILVLENKKKNRKKTSSLLQVESWNVLSSARLAECINVPGLPLFKRNFTVHMTNKSPPSSLKRRLILS